MMTIINILLGIIAGVLLVGVIGEEDPYKHKNIVFAFVTVLLFIAAANTIF